MDMPTNESAQLGASLAAAGQGTPEAWTPLASPLAQLRALAPELAEGFDNALASVLALVRADPENAGLRGAAALAETIATTCDRGVVRARQGERLEAAGLGAWRAPLEDQSYAYGVTMGQMGDLVSALEEAPRAWAQEVLEQYQDLLPKLSPRALIGMTWWIRHPGARGIPMSAYAALD